MQLAGINELNFEPKMLISADNTNTVSTPEALRPELGPLSELNYIPSNARFHGKLNQQASQGSAVVSLKTETGTVIKTWTFALNGQNAISANERVNLSQVAGADALLFEVEIATAAQSGTTIEFDSFVAVALPLTVNGC